MYGKFQETVFRPPCYEKDLYFHNNDSEINTSRCISLNSFLGIVEKQLIQIT